MSAVGFGVRTKQSRGRAFCFFALILLCGLCGCSKEARVKRRIRLYDRQLSDIYDNTRIKKSLTLDVLPRINKIQGELRSQSDNVAASLGQSKNGYKTWFNMVTFHEFDLSVIRKYFFLVDEKIGSANKRGLRFDCQVLLTEEQFDNIRTAKGAKEIVLLKGILDNLHKDASGLGGDEDRPRQDNRMLDISVMLINQVFETVFLELDRTPILATRLDDPNGIEFDHLNFGKGKIQVTAANAVVTVKIRLGVLLPTLEKYEDYIARQRPPELAE